MKPIKEWKKSAKWIAVFALLLLLGVTGSVIYSSWIVYHTVTQMYQPVERLASEPRQNLQNERKQEPITSPKSESVSPVPAEEVTAPPQAFLILGVDRERTSADKGRTDVIMLAIVNEKNKQMTLLSIPRDTYVQIAGHKDKDKVNAAYRFGVETTIATVENFTGVLIDHYVLFNFDGFVKAIDAMGGINLDLDANVARELKLSAGLQHLTGEQALEFARFRHDAQGDFGRNVRHQQVVKAVLNGGKDLLTPTAIDRTMKMLGQDVRTDLTFSDMVSFASLMHDFSVDQVNMIKYKASTARFGPQNLSYVLIDEQERERVSNLLKQALATP